MPRYKAEGNVIIQADSLVEIQAVFLDGNFYRCPIYSDVYYMQNNERRWVRTYEVWKKMAYDLKVAWKDIKVLNEPEWDEFFAISKEGKPIEDWPEEEGENHHTDEVHRITHSTSSKEYIIGKCSELGFNVIHTNDTRRADVGGILKFLNKCEANGVMGFPRIDRGSNVPEIIRGIKDHPALFGVGSDDEAEGERVPLVEQYKYYEQVKSVAPDLTVLRNWAGNNEGHTWDEFFPPHNRIKDVCDVVLFCVYPFAVGTDPDEWLQSEKDRAWAYINLDTKLMPIMQAFNQEGTPKTDLQRQWNFWKEWCNSYALYVRIGDIHEGYTGFSQDKDLNEQVKKLNKEVV